MAQENRINEFGDKVEELFKHFFKFFKEWVDDFENLAHRREKSASISPRFLDAQAKIILESFDSLLKSLTDEYLEIISEYQEISLVEKKKETDRRLHNFTETADYLIKRMNVKAELLLNDFSKSPFKSETEERLKKIENYSLNDLINKIHKSLEDSE